MFHIIDNEKNARNLIASIFKVLGYESITFSGSEEYITFVNSPGFRTPAAIFTSLKMPTMSGYEMINIIAELKPCLRFIVMTGDPTAKFDHVDNVFMYLNKPLRIHDLVKVMNSISKDLATLPSGESGCANIRNWGNKIEQWDCPQSCETCN